MSNNNSRITEIRNFLENNFERQLHFSLTLTDNLLNIIVELPENMVEKKEVIESKINNLLNINFPHMKNSRIIFSNTRHMVKHMDTEKKQRHIANIKKIILFAATKGGVGKSTTSLNSALALSKLGYKVGIVDADIYGPTIPKLLGSKQKPEIIDNKMLPIEAMGIYSISVGYLINEEQAAIWRGPMLSKMLYQLLLQVSWPELDYLIIDMPPGTGDIYLSLAENFIIDGAVLITTPQDISVISTKKSISFFEKTNIKILGIVENMSYFVDEDNKIHYIFGKSKINKINIKLLGNIPLISKITEFSDQGKELTQERSFEYYIKIAREIKEVTNS
jgi:ATP-binding protein involved in chromosome partitioning